MEVEMKCKKTKRRLTVYSVCRNVHLYAGLIWLPWMLVYATSGMFLNHRGWFDEQLRQARNFQTVEEREFTPDDALLASPADEQARAILEELGIGGRFNVQGSANRHGMTINRPSAGGNYKVMWERDHDKLIVQRQHFHIFHWFAFLHFMAGYGSGYLSSDLWAVVVDLVTLSIWIWVLTGVYLWYQTAHTRTKQILGGVFTAAGVVLFTLLALVFYF